MSEHAFIALCLLSPVAIGAVWDFVYFTTRFKELEKRLIDLEKQRGEKCEN